MKSRLFVMLVGVIAGVMGVENQTAAQEIGTDSVVSGGSVPYGGGVSQTGEALAQSLQQSNSNPSYNLRVGPVELRAEGDLTVSVNDNIGLSQSGRVSDIIITPMGVLRGRWEVSDLNTLTFNIGLGYNAYAFNPQYNYVVVAPDSEVNFNFFVGDCNINLHDDFSYQQNPTVVGQLSNQVRLSQFQNDAGVSAKWDLGDIMVEAAYDHTNLWVTESIYDYLTNQSDIFAPTFTYKINETISTGLSGSISDTRYEQGFQNDYTSEQLGPFVNATFSNFLSLTASAGGYLTQYNEGGGNGDTNSNVESYYASLGVTHQINQAFSESFTAGKQYLPGLTSNYTDRIYATYGDNWQATKEIGVSSSLFWENLTDSAAVFSEDSNRYGWSLGISDSLSTHMTLTMGYQFILKNADPSFLSYYQDVGTLAMQYNF
jgi:hypothetical protein